MAIKHSFTLALGVSMAFQTALVANAYEGGVQIAESLPTGFQSTQQWQGSLHDCGTPGFGVSTGGTLGTQQHVHDAYGQPCTKAQDIFDGRTAVNRRAIAPGSMRIRFIEPAAGGFFDQGQTIAGRGATQPDAVHQTSDGTNIKTTDRLAQTVQKWSGPQAAAQIEAEHLLSGLRQEERATAEALMESQQDRIERLRAQLREAERRQQFEADLYNRMNTGIATAEAESKALEMKWETRTTELTSQIELLQHRLQTSQAQQARMEERARADKHVLVSQVAKLSSQLGSGSGSHSYRAQVVEDIRHALQGGAGAVALNLDNGSPYMSRDIAHMPVVVQADNMKLEGLMSHLVGKLGDRWKVRWDLDGDNSYILDEPWRLVAEDTFNNIMEHIAQRVQADYGIPLTFTYFDANNLVIVSDLMPTGRQLSSY